MEEKTKYKVSQIILISIILQGIFLAFLYMAWRYYSSLPHFKLERDWAGYLFFVIPFFLILALFTYTNKNSRLSKFAQEKTLKHLVTLPSSLRLAIKLNLFIMGLNFLIIAFANPQFGGKEKEVEIKGLDVAIALDVSNSMLAKDLDPRRDRLKIAKMGIEKLINQLGQDKIAIIIFAGSAYTQLPLTSDKDAAKLFLNGISTDMLSKQGTAIGEAIYESIAALGNNKQSGKAIIIISDGENHEDDAVEAAKEAFSQNIRIYTIGMGSPKGSTIPVYKNGVETGVKKDRDGKTVITKLNEQMLVEIAGAGRGSYVRATASNPGMTEILNEINQLEKASRGSDKFEEYNSEHRPFLWIGILLLIIEILLNTQKNKLWERIVSIK
ncbi:MAG: VWA domain-containing protein [Flavobacteriales bacterium]